MSVPESFIERTKPAASAVRATRVRWLSQLLVLAMMSASIALAQSVSIYSSIIGTVTDGSGASVGGASVTATNTATNATTTTTTDSQGLYRLERLVQGSYSVSATQPGFEQIRKTGIDIASAQTVRVDLSLTLGAVNQEVTVSAGEVLINTENAQVANMFSWEQRQYLPTTSPNFYTLLAIQPATVTILPAFQVSFAGSLQNQYDYQINGMSFRGGYGSHGIQGNFTEWMEQQQTSYVGNSAEYQSLAVANVTSKSGANAYHFSGVEYYTSGGMQARNFFANNSPSLVSHNFATSAAGRIKKDRTFFYAAFMGVAKPGVTAGNATVPTAAMAAGDFTGFAPIIDPKTGQPFPGNVIPAGRISAASAAFQKKFFPAPNFGTGLAAGNYRFAVPTNNHEKNLFARIDHRFSDKHSLFGSFDIDNNPFGVGVSFTATIPTAGYRLGVRRDENVSISDVYTFSSSLFNEFGAGWTRDYQDTQGQVDGQELLATLGLQGITAAKAPAIPAMAIQGFTTVSQGSYTNSVNELYVLRDTLSWIRGRHKMKFGASVAQSRFSTYNGQPDTLLGSYTFTSTVAGAAGNAYANFLLGIPASESRSIAFNSEHLRRLSPQFFAQDNIDVTRKLTVSLGLRYEAYPPYRETAGQTYTVETATGVMVVPSQSSLQLVNPLILSSPLFKLQTSSQAGYPSSIYQIGMLTFAPRIAAAYRMGDKTVVRAGYGIFYDYIPPGPPPADLFNGNQSFAPNQIVGGTPTYQFPNPFSVNPLPVGTLSLTSFPKNVRMPYTQQWTLTVERQLTSDTSVRLSYVGSHTLEQLYSSTGNIPNPSTVAFSQSRRPLTQFGVLTVIQSGATASYNGMSVQVQHRAHNGLYVNTSYTWAKDLGIGGQTVATPVIVNPNNIRQDYGPIQWAPTHQSVTVVSLPLPVGRKRHFLPNMPYLADVIAGGWDISSIFQVRSGDHLTPAYSGYDATGTGVLTGRPDVIGDPNQVANQTVSHWFNTAAFAVPGSASATPTKAPSGPIGRYGNAGVGIINGPGVWQEDLSLVKQLMIREKLKVHLFVMGTNIFNHPNFADPATDITQPNLAGAITVTRNDNNASGINPRILQIGIRVEY